MNFSLNTDQVMKNLFYQTSAEGVEAEIRRARDAGVDLFAEFNGNGVTAFMMICISGADFSPHPEAFLDGCFNAASDEDILRVAQDTGNSILNQVLLIGTENCERHARGILSRLDHPLKARLANLPDKIGQTPLKAAIFGRLGCSVLQLLLDAGANAYTDYDQQGRTSFMQVAVGDFPEAVMQRLLDAATDDDMLRVCQGVHEASILHHAILSGEHSERNVRMILRHRTAGRLLDIPNHHGLTPTMMASMRGSDEVLQLLLNAGANALAVQNGTNQTPLDMACILNHWSTCRLLINHDRDQLEVRDHQNLTALLRFTVLGNLEAVLFLIDQGANLVADAGGATAYDLASHMDHPQVATAIMSSYAKQAVQREGRFAVHSLLNEAAFLYATRDQTFWGVRLKVGRLPISEFRTILYQLSEEVRDCSYNGSIPVHTAIEVGAPSEVLEALVGAYEAGMILPNRASLLIPNIDGDLPLHIAGRGEHVFLHNTIRCLLRQPEEQDEDAVHPALRTFNLRGDTPLQSACRGDVSLWNIQTLLRQDVSAIFLPDREGYYPFHLHLASTTNSRAVAHWKLLIPEILTARTRNGMLPFHVVALENSDSLDILFEVLKGFPDALYM